MTKEGWIEVICGSMFCGKTEELIRRIKRAEIAKQKVVVFKPKKDDRYDLNDIVAHSGLRAGSELIDTDGESIRKIVKRVEELGDIDVVAIDEGNLFPDEMVEVCEKLADKGIRVIVAGLDLNFRGEPFGAMPNLMARAEYVDKLQAICMKCGGTGTRTQRIIDGKPAKHDDPLIVIGGSDKYEARCRNCHKIIK